MVHVHVGNLCFIFQGIDESNEAEMGELLTDSTAKLSSAMRCDSCNFLHGLFCVAGAVPVMISQRQIRCTCYRQMCAFNGTFPFIAFLLTSM